MIREFHLADFLTLGNAACGVGAMLLAMLYVGSHAPIHFFAYRKSRKRVIGKKR